MPVHAFVDETKQTGYWLAATLLMPRNLHPVRRQLRQLCLPGQTRLHFAKESPSRRGTIASTICTFDIQIYLYDASAYRRERDARRACLQRLVVDLAVAQAHRLVLEQDDSLLDSDRAILFDAVHKTHALDTLAYEHLPARSEPLLWISDAAAWCWTHPGPWRDRIRPVATQIITV